MDERPVVITGGNGFVGRHLAAELVRREPAAQVISWDLPAVDLTAPATYRDQLAELQPAWIVHLAAVASAAAAAADIARARRVNVEATEALLAAAADLSPATRMLAVSTADIYGQGSSTPLPELRLGEAQPRNPYAATKWEMEKMIEEKFLDRVVRVRPFPHIGPGQGRGYVTADFASQIAAAEAGRQEPLIRVGNLAAQRDFTDVRDVVRAYRMLLEHGRPGEVYHVASGVPVRIQYVLDELLALASVTVRVEQDPARLRPSDTPILVGSIQKLQAATQWQPEIPLQQSLADILNWWRQQAA